MLLRYEGLNVNAPKNETKLMPSHIPFHKMNFSPQENAKCLPLSEGRMAEYGILTRKSYKTARLVNIAYLVKTTTHIFHLRT